MMNGKMSGAIDPKKKAIEELMQHLDQKDDMELGEIVKPKAVEVLPEEMSEHAEPDGDEAVAIQMEGGSEKPEMSPEELEELIEALQSKLA